MVDLRLEQDVKMLARQVETLKKQVKALESLPTVKLKFSPTAVDVITNFVQKLYTKPNTVTHITMVTDSSDMKEELVLVLSRNDNQDLELRPIQHQAERIP